MNFKINKICQIKYGSEIQDILTAKGIKDVNEFLHPSKDNVINPKLLCGIDKAVDVFYRHIRNNSNILIVVDPDVDGYTSASIVYQYIKTAFPNINVNYVLHKGKEHGLSDVLEYILSTESNLVIVPDAGTNDYAECSSIMINKKDVIILDHHQLDSIRLEKEVPYVDGGWLCSSNPAVIVNNQMSPNYSDKALTGVGIVYMFCKMLDEKFNLNLADDYLDLVAIGLIGDRANITVPQETYLIMNGCNLIQRDLSKNKLIQYFKSKLDYPTSGRVNPNTVGFCYTPLINAMIRIGEQSDKEIMFKALCNIDELIEYKERKKEELSKLTIQDYVFRKCTSVRNKQKTDSEKAVNVLSEQIESSVLHTLPIIVANAKDDVDKASTGLIANKLASKYRRPCMLMRRKGQYCFGSMRGFVQSGILNFSKWLMDTGLVECHGHNNAAGCFMKFDDTYKLFQLLSTMPPLDTVPTYPVYGEFNSTDISSEIVKSIAKYSHLWGSELEEPEFYLHKIPCSKDNLKLIGKDNSTLEFTFHNIVFDYNDPSVNMLELYNEINTCGEYINFNLVGKFTINKNKDAVVQMSNLDFEKMDFIDASSFNPFGM